MSHSIISHTPGKHPDFTDVRNNPKYYETLAMDAKYWSKHPDVNERWQHIFKELAQRFTQKAAFRRQL